MPLNNIGLINGITLPQAKIIHDTTWLLNVTQEP